MEGVGTVMPLALGAGTSILKTVLASSDGGNQTAVSDAAEARAQAAEAQAGRQAEAEQRRGREQTEALREQNQHRRAAARVAQAGSGLTLSGSSLLSLQSLEHTQDDQVAQLLGDSARRAADILASGAEQARSIRLSGRQSRAQGEGLGSLLRLGGQVFSVGGKTGGSGGYPTTFPLDF